jgi:hypothetical protein
MRAVIARAMARATTIGLVVPFLTFASALTSAHIHEPEPGHDHEHAFVHAHFAPHHVEAPATSRQPAVTDQDLDHNDEHIVWLDSPILHEALYQVDPMPAVDTAGNETVHVERHWSVTPFDDAAPVHGPPKPVPPFRGPPPSSSESI